METTNLPASFLEAVKAADEAVMTFKRTAAKNVSEAAQGPSEAIPTK